MVQKELPKTLKKEKQKTDQIVSEAFRANKRYFSDRERNRRRFDGINDSVTSDTDKWKNLYISPALTTSVEQKASFATEAILGTAGTDLLQFRTRQLERDDVTTILSRLVNDVYLPNVPVSNYNLVHCKSALIDGSSVMRVFWDRKTRDIKRKLPPQLSLDESGNLIAVEGTSTETVVECNQPSYEPVKVDNIWVDPDAIKSDFDDADYIIYRQVVDLNKLKAMQKAGLWQIKHLDIIKESAMPQREFVRFSGAGRNNSKMLSRLQEYDVERIQEMNLKERKDNPLIELLYVHTPYKIQLVANNIPITPPQEIYEDIKYPFVHTVNMPIQGEFWGRSDVDFARADIEHHEKLVNLIIDNYTMHLRPTLFVDSNLNKKQQEEIEDPMPGKVVRVSDPDRNIRDFRPSNFDQSVVAFAQGFIEEAKGSLGINALLEGRAPGSGIRTEGSLELFQQLGATRTDVFLRELRRTYQNIGKMFVKLIRQYADEQTVFTTAGRLGEAAEMVLKKSDIPGYIGVDVKVGGIGDPKRTQRTEQMLGLLERGFQLDENRLLNVPRALVEIFGESGLYEDPKGLFDVDPEVVEAKQQLAAAAAGKSTASILNRPKQEQPSGSIENAGQGSAQTQQLGGTSDIQRPGEGNPTGSNQFEV